MRLTGKCAIVTGAASGYGAGIARRLAADGAVVGLFDVDAAGAARVAAEIEAAAGAGRTFVAPCDVSDRASVNAAVGAFAERHQRIDAMVNNAGVSHTTQSALKISDADFDRVIGVNLRAILLFAQAVVPVMRRGGRGGALVTIASTGAVRPRPGQAVYNASKAGAVALTKTLALELAKDSIRANTVCPVAGDTPMLDKWLPGDPAENRERLRQTIPLGRLATPDDIAGAVSYLVSDDGAFVTGVTLEVDGGRCI